MGNLFVTIFGGLDPLMNTDLDFTPGAQLRSADRDGELLERVQGIIQKFPHAITKIREYTGCANLIRIALSDSKDITLQKKSFEGVSPNVNEILNFYNLSQEIAKAVCDMTARLLEEGLAFEEHAAVAKLLGDVLLFCFEFDQLKMMKPELQNDFSFYRRSLGSKALAELPKPVQPDMAQMISMWIAQNLPMTSSMTNFDPLPLAALANICCGMIIRQTCGINLPHILKVMVSAVIVFDRVSTMGSFDPLSPVKMRKVTIAISRHGGTDTQLLQNSLKFSTMHYKDESTPAYIRVALGDR